MSRIQEEFAQSAARLIKKASELGYGVTLGEASVSGLHVPANLCLLPASLNARKSNRLNFGVRK